MVSAETFAKFLLMEWTPDSLLFRKPQHIRGGLTMSGFLSFLGGTLAGAGGPAAVARIVPRLAEPEEARRTMCASASGRIRNSLRNRRTAA